MMVNEDGTPYDAPLSKHAQERAKKHWERAKKRKWTEEELAEYRKWSDEIDRQMKLHPEKILYGK